MIKILCIIVAFYPDGQPLFRAEKAFQSLEQCRAWVHQQEYLSPPERSSMPYLMACEKFWEI